MMLTRPTTLEEALTLMGSGRHRVVAGGTDVYPAMNTRPVREPMIDVTALAELRGIRMEASDIVIGAATTWTELIEAPLPPAFRALKEAARQVGGRHIQNAGTIAGNLCNASPAADGIPPLLTLDCRVEIAGPNGHRQMPLDRFVSGPGTHDLGPGELVTALRIPHPPADAQSAFEKLGSRRYLVISIAMVAALIRLDTRGRIAEARVAVGACAPVAQRMTGLEAELVGQSPNRPVLDSRHLAPLSPIDDARGTADYRRKAAMELIRRAIERAAKSDG